jgi:hypothetical protein
MDGHRKRGKLRQMDRASLRICLWVFVTMCLIVDIDLLSDIGFVVNPADLRRKIKFSRLMR